MKRILSITLLLVMVLACVSTASAEGPYEDTWYDAAKTQWKTKADYEDGVLRRFTEYPIAGSITVYTRTGWDEYGMKNLKEVATVDTGTNIQTIISNDLFYDSDIVSSQQQWTIQLDAVGNIVEHLSLRYKLFNYDGSENSVYTNDFKGITTQTSYEYNGDNRLFKTSVTTEYNDPVTDNYTGKTVVTITGGKVVELSETTQVQKEDDKGNDLGYTESRSTKYFDFNGVLQQSETSTSELDQHDREISNIWTVTNDKGIVTSSFTSTSANKYDVNGEFQGSTTSSIKKRFGTSGALEQTVTFTESSDKNGSFTQKTLVTDGTGKMLEQIDTASVMKFDENGVILGTTISEVTKYFDEKGSLLKTDTYSREMDKNYDETVNKRAVINAQNIMTSSRDKLSTFSNFLPTGYSTKSSMFDKTTGALLASIKIDDGKTYDANGYIKSEKRTSVNQAGTLIASYVSEDKGAAGRAWKTQYFHEDTGKLRKSEETLVTYNKDGKPISTTTVRNAAGIITQTVFYSDLSSGTQNREINETKVFDSVTGALKSVTTRDNIWGISGETIVKNGAGVIISKEQRTSTTDAEGFDITETLYSKYDPASGAMLGTSKGISKFKAEGNKWYRSDIRYDQQGRKVSEKELGPLFDANRIIIGDFSLFKSYNESGKVESSERIEYTDTYDAIGKRLGWSETQTAYNSDGSVSSKVTSTYNNNTKLYEEKHTDTKGKLLKHVTEVSEDALRDWTIETTRIENNYSKYTGNLMTTTTTKSREEKTGVFEENLRKVKASGQLVKVSDISYMYVDDYGYMNYQNHYTNYLYRADGSLKYTIQGIGLIDNYYFDLFMDEYTSIGSNFDPSEIIEKTTAASGVLTREYHKVKDLENGLYSKDYSKETKVYDEKTGALKSITTQTLDIDPVTGKGITHTVTVSPEGKLLAEYTSATEYDVNGREVDLGENLVAFNKAGSQIKSYTKNGEGSLVGTIKTFNKITGSLLISQTSKVETNGMETSEILTYDAAGNVIRRETKKSGTDKASGLYSYVNEVFDMSGKLLTRDAGAETLRGDGSLVWHSDFIDAAGRATYREEISSIDASGNAKPVSLTRTYYDLDDQFRKEVTEGNKTTVFDGLMQVLTVTSRDEYGASKTTDANGKLLYYSVISDAGDLSDFYANGKPKLIAARDDDNELRNTSFDKDGYINYVSITHPDRPYTMYYDGNGKVAEILYNDGAGRSAYYNAADKQWYRGTGADKVAIAVPDFADEIDMSDIETGGKARPRGVWYPNNTACTFGIHLRDVRPELTDKWYTVTPIDLSRDGVQSFELVGGNMWIIGQVNVKVEGDKVTVTRDIIKDGIGQTTTKSEYLNIFSDLNSITEEALEGDSKDGKGYAFGQPISIEKDLGGDTNVLLYVRNVATFNTRVYGERYLVRMWKNLPERKERRDAMTQMMDPLKEETAEVIGK